MEFEIRPYEQCDVSGMVVVWNEVVEAGNAFPQAESLGLEEARDFFAEQTLTTVALRGDRVCGLYILHPNNIGRCAHIANASYAVSSRLRGLGLGRALVEDSLVQAKEKGFTAMQFNAVVASNQTAIRLYEKLGFSRIGKVPGGFITAQGSLEDTYLFHKSLSEAVV